MPKNQKNEAAATFLNSLVIQNWMGCAKDEANQDYIYINKYLMPNIEADTTNVNVG